ncbi:MAG: hypothetical protein ABH858_03945 [Candidatus Omnitrophota bacterium]
MAKLKKGQKLVCVPCGREVLISSAGVSRSTIWCCGKSMAQGAKTKAKKKNSSKKGKTK